MKKFLRVILMIAIFISSGFIFSACDDDLILVTGVDLYTTEIYGDINETIDLSYKVYPSNATNKKVTFWSTDESVASVDEQGKVTIKTNGEASIIVRSVDGGYIDHCKVITNIDPDQIIWDTTDKLAPSSSSPEYSATGSMALSQVTKLKINYLKDGQVSDLVTNKNVVFTSSNPENIQVINEKEGIIKAVNNEILSGDKAFSDITATLKTASGELKITARIYINENSQRENLFINYIDGNMPVLNQRNGTETIYLTSGGSEVEFYTYITNLSGVVKTDYEMTLESGNPDLFTIETTSNENGIVKFKLIPAQDNEGMGALYIRTTCSDENGKTIRTNVNVSVQAEINSIKASATNRKEFGGMEILLNGEIFGISLDYFDAETKEIKGAERTIYFNELSNSLKNYITYYGNNQFKVTKVPEDPETIFEITGYIYVENVETSAKIPFSYEFYLRNSLESLIVSETKKDGSNIPTKGTNAITIPVGGSVNLFAYATTFDFSSTEPTGVSCVVSDSSLINVSYLPSEKDKFTVYAGSRQGIAIITFVATDGIISIEYEVTVYVVAQVAEIKFYSSTTFTEENELNLTTSINKVYINIEPTSGYMLENPSAINISVDGAELKTEVIGGKVYRYFEINTSSWLSGQFATISVECDRYLTTNTITIEKL